MFHGKARRPKIAEMNGSIGKVGGRRQSALYFNEMGGILNN